MSTTNQQGMTIDEFLERVRPEHLARVELETRTVLEPFVCPATIRDDADFDIVFADFYLDYLQHLYPNCSLTKTPERRKTFGLDAKQTFARLLGKDSFWTSVTNAIYNRDGGIQTLIDRCRESLVRQQLETYVDLRIHDYIQGKPAYEAYNGVVKTIVTRFGKLLFPNETMPIYPMLTHEANAFITNFILQLYRMNATFRR